MKRSISAILACCLSLATLFISTSKAELETFGEEKCHCDCFRGKSLGECKSYWVLETGFMIHAGNSSVDRYDDYENIFTANVGKMFNISNKSAIGGTVNIAPSNGGMDIGVGPRYRYWMSEGMAFDFSPRMMLLRTGDYDIKGVGFQIDASLSIGELFSIDTYYRNVRYEPNFDFLPLSPGNFEYIPYLPQSKGFYFGFSGRSYAAPVVPALILLFDVLLKHDDPVVITF